MEVNKHHAKYPEIFAKDMPLLKAAFAFFKTEFGENFEKLKKNKTTLFIIVQHGHASIAKQTEYLVATGVPINNIYVLLKPNTTPNDPAQVREYWQECYGDRCNISPDLSTIQEPENHYTDHISKILFEKPCYVTDIIVCDEGGKLIDRFIKDYLEYSENNSSKKSIYNVVYVAHTQSDKIGNKRLDKLPFTMIDMAGSFVKAKIESHIIAYSILTQIKACVSLEEASIKIAILGVGNIGEAIIHQLALMCQEENKSLNAKNFKLYLYDSKIKNTQGKSELKKIIQTYKGRLTLELLSEIKDNLLAKLNGEQNIIIGSTASDCLAEFSNDDALINHEKKLHIFSASSGNREYPCFTVDRKNELYEDKNNQDKIGLKFISHNTNVIFYNQGRPINFIPFKSEIELLCDIQLTRLIKYMSQVFALVVIELVPFFKRYQEMSGINLREKQYLKLSVEYQLKIIDFIFLHINDFSSYFRKTMQTLDCSEKAIRENSSGMVLPNIQNMILHDLLDLMENANKNHTDNLFFRQYPWLTNKKLETTSFPVISEILSEFMRCYLVIKTRKSLSFAISFFYALYHQNQNLFEQYNKVFFLKLEKFKAGNFNSLNFSNEQLTYILDQGLFKYANSSYGITKLKDIIQSLKLISETTNNVLFVIAIDDSGLKEHQDLIFEMHTRLVHYGVKALFIITSHFLLAHKSKLPQKHLINFEPSTLKTSIAVLEECLLDIAENNKQKDECVFLAHINYLASIIDSRIWSKIDRVSIDFLLISMQCFYFQNRHYLLYTDKKIRQNELSFKIDIVKASFIFLFSLIYAVFDQEEIIDLNRTELNNLQNQPKINAGIHRLALAFTGDAPLSEIIDALSRLAINYYGNSTNKLDLEDIVNELNIIGCNRNHADTLIKMFFYYEHNSYIFCEDILSSLLAAYHTAKQYMVYYDDIVYKKLLKIQCGANNKSNISWLDYFTLNFLYLYQGRQNPSLHEREKIIGEFYIQINRLILKADSSLFLRVLFRLIYEKNPEAAIFLINTLRLSQQEYENALHFFQLTITCIVDVVFYLEDGSLSQYNYYIDGYMNFFYYCISHSLHDELEVLIQPMVENPSFFIWLYKEHYITESLSNKAVTKKLPWFLFLEKKSNNELLPEKHMLLTNNGFFSERNKLENTYFLQNFGCKN